MKLGKLFSRKAGKGFTMDTPMKRIFITTPIKRPSSMSGHQDYYCLAAEEKTNGQWEVYRRRYSKTGLNEFHAHTHVSIGNEHRFCSLEEAYKKLQDFEREHADYKHRLDQIPADAKHVSDMAELVTQTRLAMAAKSGALPKTVLLARRRAGLQNRQQQP